MDQNIENPLPADPEPVEEMPLIDPFASPPESSLDAESPVSFSNEPLEADEILLSKEVEFARPVEPEIVNVANQPPPKKNSNGWVVALIVFLVLCCCCVIIFVPLVFFTRIFASLLGDVYTLVIDILNSIFGGIIQFY